MHLKQHHSSFSTTQPRTRRSGFSLTELLVVIGIIVLLVGLLLVALGKVQKRAQQTRTDATMQQFANACAAFQAEHGFYPGVIPEDFLQFADQGFSSTENALLHMMGGYRALSPMDDPASQAQTDYTDFLTAAQNNSPPSAIEYTFTNTVSGQVWKLAVDRQRIGEGPIINGKSYPAYFTGNPDQLVAVEGQVTPATGNADDNLLMPDLIDAWGQPIIYLRQMRGRGPLLKTTTSTGMPQFSVAGAQTYLQSTGLGELVQSQRNLSILGSQSMQSADDDGRAQALATIIAHPAFYKSPPIDSSPRGAFVLISAGPDGVYFSIFDGPGDTGAPIGDLTVIVNGGPKVIDEFDDVRVYSGG